MQYRILKVMIHVVTWSLSQEFIFSQTGFQELVHDHDIMTIEFPTRYDYGKKKN